MYSKVVMNLVGAQKRYETLNNKRHLVVPAVMLTEGVHNGSQGPLLYEKEEMSKNPQTWNMKPVVIYHPTINGEGTTACSPDILEKQQTGLLFKTSYEDKLRTEVWFEEDKLKKTDNRVFESIENNKMVEVSTGLYHDLDPTSGVYNGKKYIGIVRNIQPDHLAILPDQVGACSIADGGGLLRNADELSYDDIREQIRSLLKGSGSSYSYCYVCDVFAKYAVFEKDDKCFKTGYKIKEGKVSLVGDPEEVWKRTSYVTANNEDVCIPIAKPSVSEVSEVMRKQQLQSALQSRFNEMGEEKGDWSGWVVYATLDNVVWFKDGKLFRLPYTYDADKVSFGTGEPEEVTNNTKGFDMAAKQVANAISSVGDLGGGDKKNDGQPRTTDGGARAAMVNKLAGKFGEAHRSYFEAMNDELLGKVAGDVDKGAKEEIVSYGYSGIADRSSVNVNQLTANQYVENAPPEVREALREAMNITINEKKRLVGIITANKNNKFSEKWLMNKVDMDQLRGLAALAGSSQQKTQVNNFSGQADIPMFNDYSADPTQNSNQPEEFEALPIPCLNWDDEKKVG